MNKPERKQHDWHKAIYQICGCGEWAAVVDGKCPLCHDAEYEFEVEQYYLNKISELERKLEYQTQRADANWRALCTAVGDV